MRAHVLCYALATVSAITRTTVDVGARVRHVRSAHYFDTPVPQPRQGQRVADRSGLRPWPCAVPLLQHLSEATVPALETSGAAAAGPGAGQRRRAVRDRPRAGDEGRGHADGPGPADALQQRA